MAYDENTYVHAFSWRLAGQTRMVSFFAGKKSLINQVNKPVTQARKVKNSNVMFIM